MDVQISDLEEVTTINDTDLLVLDVDNGDGSYTTKKIKFENF